MTRWTAARCSVSRPSCRAGALAAFVVLGLLATRSNVDAQAGASDDEPMTTSTLEGVFTAEQAQRGEATFQDECSECHAPGFFTARTFRQSWSGLGLYWLFKQIRTAMPENNPGSLKRDEVADVLAYILRLNGYPPGQVPLPGQDDPLRLIILEELPDGGASP